MFLSYSSGGPGQSSAKSGDKAFEDWLSDDVNSYQRWEPHTLYISFIMHLSVLNEVFKKKIQKNVYASSVEGATVGIKRIGMLALATQWPQRRRKMTSSTMPCLLFIQ